MVRFSRNELYDQVWQTPMCRLALDYGLSDVGLSKICRKLKIPTPPRGYWARLQSGYKVERAPLPELDSEASTSYSLRRPSGSRRNYEKQCIKDYGITLSRKIRAPKKLSSPHPLILTTHKALKNKKPNEYGLLRAFDKRAFNIRVSPAMLNRALRIIDGLLRGLEANGYPIKVDLDRKPSIYAEIEEEQIDFSIKEKTRRVAHVVTEKEFREQEKHSWMRPLRWDYIPTGKLSLHNDVWGATGCRKKWSDTSSKSLEDMLNDFVIGAIRAARVLKQEQLKRENERKRWEEECRMREEERQRIEVERQRLRELENQAQFWARSEQLRAYIRAVETAASKQPLLNELQEELAKWVLWASAYADRLDPLQGGLPIEKPMKGKNG